MRFNVAIILSLAASVLALPASEVAKAPLGRRADKLAFRPYAEFQVSDGTAGNALAEVQAKFPIDETALATVSAADLAVLKAARKTAENAETDGFNGAVKAATGEAATALQNGKIKNKVLKLALETMALKIEQAQGASNQDKIDAENKKLQTNIALDTKAAGQKSTSVAFTADVKPVAGKGKQED